MIDVAAALRAGAAALLVAEGEAALADLVVGADVELVGSGEPWSMGSRSVTAQRVAIVVDAPVYTALSAAPAKLQAIRTAFAAAMRTPETELADLSLVLRLPAIQRSWHRAYRDAPPAAFARGGERGGEMDRPDPSAVLGGAAALAEAAGDGRAAAMLRRATLEAAEVSGASFPPLLRCVLRLDPADLATAQRDAALSERLRRAVHDAGTRAVEVVATVDLGVSLRVGASAPPGGPEALLSRALSALGVTVVPVARGDAGEVTLALIGGGEVRVLELVPGAGEPVIRSRKKSPAAWLVVPLDAARDEASAREAAAMLFEELRG